MHSNFARNIANVRDKFFHVYDLTTVGASASISSIFSATLLLNPSIRYHYAWLAMFILSQVWGFAQSPRGPTSFLSHIGVSCCLVVSVRLKLISKMIGGF